MGFSSAWTVTGSWPQPARGRVLYLNEDNDRVRAALRRLRLAVENSEWWARHPVAIDHVAVDPADPNLHDAIRKALTPTPAAIIAASGHLAIAAKGVTSKIPIIFGAHQDPVARGIVRSMKAPEANVTGLTLYAPIEGKRLELLRALRPDAYRIGVVVNRWWDEDPSHVGFEKSVRDMGFQARYYRAESSADLAKIVGRRAEAIDGWYVSNEPAFTEPDGVVRIINSTGKPAVYTMSLLASRGGLMSYQAIVEDPFAIWAKLLGMILDGTPPARIPVEGPRVFELQINATTARALGLTIPKALLVRATRVY